MNRVEILRQAEQCITRDRAATHGDAEDSFTEIAGHWRVYLQGKDTATLGAYDVAMMMSLFKVARAKANRKHGDNFIDLVGYAALAGEIGGGHE